MSVHVVNAYVDRYPAAVHYEQCVYASGNSHRVGLVWDDKCLATSTFAKICPTYSSAQVRAFERRFLELLQYQAVVTQGLYARYYFELRDLFERLMAQRGSEGAAGGTDPRTAGSASTNGSSTVNFPLQPLSLWRAKQLE
eukprot:4304-Heterococcus_DN1.PRE.1